MSAVIQQSNEEKVILWCKQYIGGVLSVDPATISEDDDLDRYGLDSAITTSMIIDMEDEFGADVPASILFSQGTIRGIAAEVAKRIV